MVFSGKRFMAGWVRTLCALAALAAMLAACAVREPTEVTRPPEEAPRIPVSSADGKWELTDSTFIGAGRIPGVPRATLVFEHAALAAYSGCNRAKAQAYHRAGRLELDALDATRRACPEPLRTFEARYFKLLRSHPVYRVEGDMLLLLDGEQSARFRRMRGPDSAP